MQLDIRSGGLTLRGYLVRPELEPGQSCGLLLLCHGFPAGPKGAAGTGQTYPQLADRLSGDAGWAVQLVGRYHDTLRNDDGTWRFQRRVAEFVA